MIPYDQIRIETTEALSSILLKTPSDEWLRRFVDAPRFGWDWESIEIGFLKPLHALASQYGMRLRPLFAATLIDACGGEPTKYCDSYAAIELLYLAAIMLDSVRNGRNLSQSTADHQAIPLPVWVTIAYNARQLAPVMMYRDVQSLPLEQRSWLALRMSEHLFTQGIGSAFDLWGEEHAMQHPNVDHLLEYLRLYIGPLSFRIACDVASAALGLTGSERENLANAGCDFGVAMRLAALAEGESAVVRTVFGPSPESTIRWNTLMTKLELKMAAEKFYQQALDTAANVHPALAQAFRHFRQEVLVSQLMVAL